MSDVIWERDEYPVEPAGPVWDQDGDQWNRHSRGWKSSWASSWPWSGLCAYSRRLTSTPPWKPEVGGTVETLEQFRALPEGSVVATDGSGLVFCKQPSGLWCATWQTDNRFADMKMAGTSRTILRVGWSL